jgi:hypothetical protein|tara:strand:+ start:1001 stop:1624 length:624 start_codon:yes stop_codon:yes gene_type:complete
MTTYAELVQNIKDFMEDDGTEFSNEIDKFIDLSELRLSRDLKTPEFKRKVTSAFSASDPFLTMPTDLVLLENLHLINSNVRTVLLLKSDEFILEFWPNRTSTGTPKYYSYFDTSTIYVAPTPSTNFSLELSYKRRLPALSSSNTSNWTSINAADALLYACLIEASIFNRNFPLQERYVGMYKEAVKAINNEQLTGLSSDDFYKKSEG